LPTAHVGSAQQQHVLIQGVDDHQHRLGQFVNGFHGSAHFAPWQVNARNKYADGTRGSVLLNTNK
jgi:hypothetical protein